MRALLAIALSLPVAALARDVPVATPSALVAAVNDALPGDRILIEPGTYLVTQNLVCDTVASAALPIEVRARTARTVLVRFANAGGVTEGFRPLAPYWRFEGLDIEGACTVDSDCEHAFHLAGDADFTVIRDNRIRDFNAQIKSNTAAPDSGQFPDDVLIERNELYDTRARNTSNPVTKMDVVGGRRWIVRGNDIHDFQKGGGDTISYGAFLKGNARDGLMERNLVRCARDFTGGVRIGLSLGGGGTSPGTICEGGTCDPEHQGGVLRNNLVLACSDVGVYLNRAANTRIEHNTLYDTSGIDVRFTSSSADVRNNLLSGAIRNRDGGTSTQAGNLASVPLATFATWFRAPAAADFALLDGSTIVDQGAAAPLVPDDYCGNLRDDGARDTGALEYDLQPTCDTRFAGGFAAPLFADGFE